MLSNFDIERLCQKLDLPLVGVYQKDVLKTVPVQIGSYYVNQQNSDDGDGTHWVLIKIYSDDDRDNGGSSNGMAFANALYFDPFGLNMSEEVEEFLRPFKPVPFNNRQIQSVRTSQCGWYCIACDYALEYKQYRETYLEDYELFLNHFSEDPNKNLTLLKEFFAPL